MARLDKAALRDIIASALCESGYEVEIVGSDHPFRIIARNNASEENLTVYVWNVTHGGKNRAED